jgi:polyisoprenoid-binding protein YceI
MRNPVLLALVAALFFSLSAAQPARAAETWEVDPVHSSIVWAVGHMGGVGKVYGRFNSFSGTIVTDADNLENSSVHIVVDASSVDSAVAARDEHLRNPDFFNTESFPQLSFHSTNVEAGDEEGVFVVTGDLTLLGVSKEITIMVRLLGIGEGRGGVPVAGFESKFSIMRSEWGMGYGIPGLSDEIEVMLAFEAKGTAPAAE